MAIEYELKFSASEAALTAIKKAYPHGQTHFEMRTTYYDTPSETLSARHYTLRTRLENDACVCTLKTPLEGNGRQELELPCSDVHIAAAWFAENGAPVDFGGLVSEGLIPVCGAAFHRIAIFVELETCAVEIALDTGTLFGGEQSREFCEVEVELKSGDARDATRFAAQLATLFCLQPQPHSKFQRAFGLYKGANL